MTLDRGSKIYVAGHSGMVGSAVVRRLKGDGFSNIITRSSKELDLRRQADVEHFFASETPDYVVLAAAKVGGIAANSQAPADFLYDNMIIEMNVIHEAWVSGVKKFREWLSSQ